MRHIHIGIGEFERIDVILLAGQTVEEPRVYMDSPEKVMDANAQ